MMPVGYSLDDWEKELHRRKRIYKRIRKLSDDIQCEEDSLGVLRDEIGSERWMKHNNRMYNLIVKRDKLLKEASGW